VHKAVFLDRDGTIAKDVPYCSRPEDFELLPGVAEGIKLLNERGFKVVIITNQSGIARGYFTEGMLASIHDKMQKELAKHGAHVDAIYYCPHHPDNNCECRKPKPKMVLQAAIDLDIDLSQSYVIGGQLHSETLYTGWSNKQKNLKIANLVAVTHSDKSNKLVRQQDRLSAIRAARL